MTIDELSVSAANGTIPDGLTAPERAVWYPLRDLYKAVRDKHMTAVEAKREKSVLAEQYDRDVKTETERDKAMTYNADLWKRIERAATVYAKSDNRTPEADAFYHAVYGIAPGTDKNRIG